MLKDKKLIILLVICLFAITTYADQTILHPLEDVHIVTYNIPTGIVGFPFLKFNISSIPLSMTIDSVYLQVYVFEVYTGWDGDVIFWNVNSQTWTENDGYQEIWNIPTSDSTYHGSGFGEEVGWAKSIDLKAIFLLDYNAVHTYTSIKMGDYDSQAGSALGKVDSDDTLAIGWAYVPTDGIRFYPHEYMDTTYLPTLVVYYSGTDIEFPSKNILQRKVVKFEISPNPFMRETNIRWQIIAKGEMNDDIRLEIRDGCGRLVRDLSPKTIKCSNYVSWDGTDDKGKKLTSGIYFCRLTDGERSVCKKIIIVK